MLPVYRAGSQKGRASMHTGNLPPTKDTSYSHAKHETLWRGIVQQQRKFGKVITPPQSGGLDGCEQP
jgi:hypothetical protein